MPQTLNGSVLLSILLSALLSMLLSELTQMEISMLESDWIAPNDPVLNANFLPITALLSRSTCQGLPSTLSPNLIRTPNKLIS